MNKKILQLKTLIFLVLTILNYGCSDNCADSDLATNFPIKFKILSSNGSNQLSNATFDKSLLRIIDPLSSSSFGFDFSIEELNGELIIKSYIINTKNIIVEYDGINRFEVILSNKKTKIIDCTVETLSFTATSSDGSLLCNCDIDDVVTIAFDL